MAISKKEIEHIAKLSMLEIDEKHFEKLANDMNAIVEMVDKLKDLDTGKVVDLIELDGNYNIFREDEIKPSFSRKDILANAPEKKDNCFFVPKIVE